MPVAANPEDIELGDEDEVMAEEEEPDAVHEKAIPVRFSPLESRPHSRTRKDQRKGMAVERGFLNCASACSLLRSLANGTHLCRLQKLVNAACMSDHWPVHVVQLSCKC